MGERRPIQARCAAFFGRGVSNAEESDASHSLAPVARCTPRAGNVTSWPEFNPRKLMISDLLSPPALNVMLIYEDLAAGRRAKELLDRLRHRLGPEAEMEIHLCRFDLLQVPQFREEAMEHGLGADILILSARHGVEVPSHVQDWLETCRNAGASRSAALVMLLDEPRPVASAGAARSAPVRLSVTHEAPSLDDQRRATADRWFSLAAVGKFEA